MTTLKGKIALITGGTSGLGMATAHALAKMGATTVIVGRNPQKTAGVVQEIRAASGNQEVYSLLADLSSQQDIYRLASDFKRQYSQLHILVNNAGATYPTRQFSVDGIEMTFALNHLAYFLLTNLLLDTLTATSGARIVNVASGLYRMATMNFANLQGEKFYYQFLAYNNSKLANMLFTVELAERLKGTGVTVNALNPRVVNTPMQQQSKESGLVGRLVSTVVSSLFARTPEEGAKTSIYLASSAEVEGVTGGYFTDSKAYDIKGQAADPAVAKHLWEVSEALTHLTPEAV